jgi:hypothetical protein
MHGLANDGVHPLWPKAATKRKQWCSLWWSGGAPQSGARLTETIHSTRSSSCVQPSSLHHVGERRILRLNAVRNVCTSQFDAGCNNGLCDFIIRIDRPDSRCLHYD